VSTRLVYTFQSDDTGPYPGKAYVTIETETPDQQRPAAAVIFGLTENGAVNFAFDYSEDIFFHGRDGKGPGQPEKYSLYLAAAFSLLPVTEQKCEHGTSLSDLCRWVEDHAEQALAVDADLSPAEAKFWSEPD
jgi:hypothetical protein